MNPPHPVYHWFVHMLARAFDVQVFHIKSDPALKSLCEAVICNRFGKGRREGTVVDFDPQNQTITFSCQAIAQAREIEEVLGAKKSSRYDNILVIDVPCEFFLKDREGNPLLPPPIADPRNPLDPDSEFGEHRKTA